MLSKQEYLQPFLNGRSGVGGGEYRSKRSGEDLKMRYDDGVQDVPGRLLNALQQLFPGSKKRMVDLHHLGFFRTTGTRIVVHTTGLGIGIQGCGEQFSIHIVLFHHKPGGGKEHHAYKRNISQSFDHA